MMVKGNLGGEKKRAIKDQILSLLPYYMLEANGPV